MIGKAVFNDWTVESLIGKGSFGSVYKISKEEYGVKSSSALKVITVPQSESDLMAVMGEGMDEVSVTTYFEGVVSEIVREVSVMSQLKGHPNVVAYEDHKVIQHEGTIGWDIFIRMELLSSLISHQLKNGFTLKQVVKMGMELTDALVLCHSKGLIHRDIKPDNIFMNEYGVFKLGDFGVARTVENAMSVKSKKGTEVYMAPEVYLGKSYDATVDLYSLGIVLYKCLNGNRLPFLPPANQPIKPGDRETALIERISGKPLPRPMYGDDALVAIINKACAFDIKDRYHSANEMLEDLTAYYGLHHKDLDVKVLAASSKASTTAVVQAEPKLAVPTPVAVHTVTPQVVSQTAVLENNKADDYERTVGVRHADFSAVNKASIPSPAPMKAPSRPGAVSVATSVLPNDNSNKKESVDNKNKKKNKTPLIIAIAVISVALIGGGIVFVLSSSNSKSKSKSTSKSEPTATTAVTPSSTTVSQESKVETTVKDSNTDSVTTTFSIDGEYRATEFDIMHVVTISRGIFTYTMTGGNQTTFKTGTYTFDGKEIVVTWDQGGTSKYTYDNGIVMNVMNSMGTKSVATTLKAV